MVYYLVKLMISASLIVLVSEVSKRTTLVGGLLASLPLVSYLAMIWLYAETRDTGKIADLSWSILWLVLPSLVFFVALPMFLKKLHFGWSMALATALMFAAYGLMLLGLKRFGIQV